MESLKLPKTKVKGLYLYCPTHGKHFSSDRKTCGCPNLAYKARYHIPQHLSGGLKRCRTKIIPATNYHEAAALALEFEKSLKEQDYGSQVSLQGELVQSKPVFVPECISAFMKFLRNEGVPFQFQRPRCKAHLDEIEKFFRYFQESLKLNGINPVNLRFDRITDTYIGYYCQYLLEDRNFGAWSYNKGIKSMKRLFEYIREEFYPNIKNLIKKVPLKIGKSENLIVSEYELNRMFELITRENGNYTKPSGKKENIFRPWLRDCFRLHLYTGGRRSEVVNLKWNGIRIDENGNPIVIGIPHQKINGILGITNERDKLQREFIITKELMSLLKEMGYDKYRNTDKYIVGPEETMSRLTLTHLVTTAFTHYYNQLQTGRPICLKHLRKTFITSAYEKYGINAIILTGHTELSTILKHYVNLARIRKNVINEFSVF